MPGVIPAVRSVAEEGTVVATRPTLNFIGAAVTASDNSAQNRTDVTIGSSPFFDVKATYGAAGDGSADDTAEIQAAIDAAEATNGGIVFFPPGTYKVTSTLTVTASVTLLGAGSPKNWNGTNWNNGVSKIVATSMASSDVIACAGSGVYIAPHIENLLISASGTKTAGAGLRLTATTGATVRNVLTFGQYDGVVVDGSFSWALDCENLWAVNSTRYGVNIAGGTGAAGAGELHFRNLVIGNVGATYGTTGLRIAGGSGCFFNNADILAFSTAVEISGLANYCWFANVLTDTCTLGWSVTAGDSLFFDHCYAADNVTKGTGVSISGGQNIRWRAGSLSYFNTAGFNVSGGSDISICDVAFQSYDGTTTSGKPLYTSGTIAGLTFNNNEVGEGWTGTLDFAGRSHTNLCATGNKGLAAITYPAAPSSAGTSGSNRVNQNQVAGSWTA